MINGERPDCSRQFRDCVQGHQLSSPILSIRILCIPVLPIRRADIQHRQCRRIHLVLVLQLRDHTVCIIGGIDGRDLPLAVGGVKRVFNLFRGDAQSRCLIPIDFYVDLRIGNVEVAGDILQHVAQLWIAAQFVFQLRRVAVKLLGVWCLQRELVLALGQVAADADRWQHLRKCHDPGHRGQLGPQFLDQFLRRLALTARLQTDENASGIASRRSGHVGIHPRLLHDNLVQSRLVPRHVVK